MAQIFLYATILLAGIYGLLRSSTFVIRSLSAISRYIGVSELILSFILLSVATSLSELSVGVNAALTGVPELSLGDVFGTNIVNITLILGIIAIIGKGITLQDYEHFKRTRLMTLLLVLAPFVLLLNGALSRIDGIILVSLFIIRIIFIIKNNQVSETNKSFKHSMAAHVHHSVRTRKEFWRNIGTFFISVSVLVLSAYGVVWAIGGIAEYAGIPEFILGLFLVALGTSLPELSVGLRAARSGKESISVGNLFGAISINSTLVLGVVAIIHPIHVTDTRQYAVTAGMMILAMCLVYYFLRYKHSMHKLQGLALLGIYALFLLIQSIAL